MNIAVRAATISLVVTLGLLLLKLTLGLLSGSIAVLSDALDSGEDLLAAAAALFSVRVAARPADWEHPYGHGKAEGVSATVSAGVVGLGGGLIVYQAVKRIISGGEAIDVDIGLAAMVTSAVLNTLVSANMRIAARRTGSLALSAEARHLQTNVVQALAVIAGLLLVRFTEREIFDPLTALALAAYMWWMAFGLVRSALGEIMDVRLPAEDERQIQESIHSHHPEVRGYHHLRTRRSGHQRYVELHLLVDPSRTIQEVHNMCDHIEAEIEKRLPGAIVTIHTEPDDGRYRGPLESIQR
ncbi:MAG: cation diffusion facilitator family transporter [Chloroflexota bacterium]|nr:cation diffusion facilitator family transporter [Chloroflexota bacterium]